MEDLAWQAVFTSHDAKQHLKWKGATLALAFKTLS